MFQVSILALLESCSEHPQLSFHLNNDCYRVITRSLNFRMAEEFCFAYGGFLAITDSEEQIGKLTPFLNQLVSKCSKYTFHIIA